MNGEYSQAAAEVYAVQRLTEKQIDKKIAESGVDNPYTGRPFSGVEEFLAYGRKLKEDCEGYVRSGAGAPVKLLYQVLIHNEGFPLRFESTSVVDIFNCLFYSCPAGVKVDWENVFVNLARLSEGGFAWQINDKATVYAIRPKRAKTTDDEDDEYPDFEDRDGMDETDGADDADAEDNETTM